MNTERNISPENPIQKWTNRVKKEIAEGRALGVVTARTNFDITVDASGNQQITPRTHEGYTSEIFQRGKISPKDGETLYNFMGQITSHETGFPRDTKEKQLYVSIVKPADIKLSPTQPRSKLIHSAARVMQEAIGKENSIVEVRYKQPKADSYGRTSEKWVYLVVPDKTANQLAQMVQSGLDPNKLHEAVAEVFTTPETRHYFDANIVDRRDPEKIAIKATPPNFQETFFTYTAPSAPLERTTIQPNPSALISIPSAPEPSNKPEPAKPPESKNPDPFESELRGLIYAEKGKDLEVKDEKAQDIARLALLASSRTSSAMDRILEKGNDLVLDGKMNFDDWAKVAGVIWDERERLATGRVEKHANPEVQKVQVMENIPTPEDETPEGWARFILTRLDLAEKASERKMLRTYEDKDTWDQIDKTLAAIPDKMGKNYIPRETVARNYFNAKHPEGFYLRERLAAYVEARKHINDRYLEITKANGSLTAMGLGKDEVPFEGISYKLQVINNEDWWAIYHGDEIFPELSPDVAKELAPNVSEASEKWLNVGIAYKTLPKELLTADERAVLNKIFAKENLFNEEYQKQDKDKLKKRTIDPQKFWPSPEDVFKVLGGTITMSELEAYASIPTFDNSRNVTEFLTEIRARLRDNLGSPKSEDLALRVLTTWLTIPLLDRNRSGAQGNSEERDLMWSERKRVYELGDKEREPGVDWTVGRIYVSSPDQGSAIKPEDARSSAKLRHRKETLEINAERGILVEPDSYFEGEVVSDFLHNNFFSVRDELVPGKAIRRNMASYVINGDGTVRKDGFKNIPYLRMGQSSYSGYFGYTLNKAKQINADLTGISWKDPAEMVVDDYWNKKRDLIERMEHISPRFITREYQFRGKVIQELLLDKGGFNENEVAKIAGYSDERDLDVISNPAMRKSAHDIITENGEAIAKVAKKRADVFWGSQSAKIRMVHAMGQVWTGSLDGIEETSNLVTASTITPTVMRSIITAITVSRYLEGEALEQFKHEIWKEMGFGTKWGAGRKSRYRRKINAELWD